MSWRRGAGSRTSISMTPSTPSDCAWRAARRAAATSCERSPEFERVCRPTRIRPSGRIIAGWPSGSRVTMSKSAPPCSSVVRPLSVAQGMISRIATSSTSLGSPSKGRSTKGIGGRYAGRSALTATFLRREAFPMGLS